MGNPISSNTQTGTNAISNVFCDSVCYGNDQLCLLDCYNGCSYACPLNEGGPLCQDCMNCFYNGICNRFNPSSSNATCLCNTGFDPTINCLNCLPHWFGPQGNSTCPSFCPAGNYHCSAGVNGTGQCVCNGNYDISTNCNDCLPNFDNTTYCTDCITHFYGSTCSQQCLKSCHNGNCSTGINGTGECICNDNYDPATNCSRVLNTSSKNGPTWELPVIVSVTVGSVVLIAIGVTAYYLGRRVNKVFEEVVVGDNIHATELIEPGSTTTSQGFFESKTPTKSTQN